MDDNFFSLDTIGQKNNIESNSDTSSLPSKSSPLQVDEENDIKEDIDDISEDLITLKYNINRKDTDLTINLRNHIYKLLHMEPFCKSAYANEHECELVLCNNGLTKKVNDMSFLLRQRCGNAYPRFLHFTKVKLSKHTIQASKRYYTNISDLASSGKHPKPIMDFTHCLAALYLMPKRMCYICGRRDCRKTWIKEMNCEFYPCEDCGKTRKHKCRYMESITHRMKLKHPPLPPFVRDYLASSTKCIVCGRVGHLNCAKNKPEAYN